MFLFCSRYVKGMFLLNCEYVLVMYFPKKVCSRHLSPCDGEVIRILGQPVPRSDQDLDLVVFLLFLPLPFPSENLKEHK
jgi:hypothetical protein